MSTAINTELFKISRKRGTVLALLVAAIWSMAITVVFYFTAKESGGTYTAASWPVPFADLLSTYMIWLLIAFAFLIVSTDYVEGTASNQITVGISRVQQYAAKLVTYLLMAVIMVTLSFTVITVFSGFVYGWGNWDNQAWLVLFKTYGRFLLFVLPFTAHFSLLSSSINSQAGSIISCFFLITVMSLLVQLLKFILPDVQGIEESSPFVAGHVIGRYDAKYFLPWLLLCLGVWLVSAAAGTALAARRDLK